MIRDVTVTWADVRIRDAGPDMPPHLADYGETPETWDRWHAWWEADAMDRGQLKGCPLGRANTRDAAVADLLWRTERESGVRITGLEGPRPEPEPDADDLDARIAAREAAITAAVNALGLKPDDRVTVTHRGTTVQAVVVRVHEFGVDAWQTTSPSGPYAIDGADVLSGAVVVRS